MFNTELWDYSILRLNQLGYFEVLKKEEAADIKRNTQSNTVDITLKVKERDLAARRARQAGLVPRQEQKAWLRYARVHNVSRKRWNKR